MTTRIPVSTTQNHWNDAQRVDRTDMVTEQTHKNQNDAAIINNHFGSGILPSAPTQVVLFDSTNLNATQAALLAAGNFDGTGLSAHVQPSDSNLGNQLEVELIGPTDAFGRLSTKVLIIGTDFQSQIQYDRFWFYKAEKQVTRKHYTRILAIFFIDFKGNNNCSRDLGGEIVIREAASFQLSRDPIMVAQDTEPNLFFRDFKVADAGKTLSQTIQDGIGSEFSFDALDINTTVKQNRTLVAGDVVTKIGQKFNATTNNIQKITLLLGAGRDDEAAVEDRYDWTGELVVSVYELQTTVSCPTDIVPELAIEFEPKPQPIAQLSFDQADLEDIGYVLTDIPQPVDFVFSDTKLGSTTNPTIVAGRYYVVTINRAGAANSGMLFTGVGNNVLDDGRLTLYAGTSWVDVPEEDMWFQVWTDAAKVADGQAYDAGNGIQIEKTEINEDGAEVDFAFDAQPFADSGEGILNTGVVQAVQAQSVEEQDERTGNEVFSRQKFEAEFSFVTNADLEELKAVSEPLIIGCASDINPKLNENFDKIQTLPGLAKGDTFIVVNPDADLLSNTLLGSKLIPNVDNIGKNYRIYQVKLCSDGYGDVDGNGIIDSFDIARAAELIGESLSSATTQQKIVNGEIDTLELIRADVDGDGYITTNDVNLITQYVNRQINGFSVGSTFTHLEIKVQNSIGRYDGYFDCDGYIRLDGYGGKNVVTSGELDPVELIYDGYFAPIFIESDAAFTTVPFVDVTYRILAQPFWQDYLVVFNSHARQVPAAFTFDEEVEDFSTSTALCTDRSDVELSCSPGRTDFFVPDNLIIGSGQIIRPDGTPYPVDFEVGQVILQLPEEVLEEAHIDVFNKFVAEASGGKTSAGYNAMKFADGSFVSKQALALNQVRFHTSLQALNVNLDGYEDLDGFGVIVNPIVGIHMSADGILTLNLRDLEVDSVLKSLVTKIQISVFLKKGSFNNEALVIEPSAILGLISS